MTLPELALALVLAGLVSVIAIPRFADALDRVVVDRTAYAMIAAHHRARITAIAESRPTTLRLTADSIVIRVLRGGQYRPSWRGPGPRRQGIAMSGPTKTMVFSPTGVTVGFSNGRWILQRRHAYREVIMSRLGRARMVR